MLSSCWVSRLSPAAARRFSRHPSGRTTTAGRTFFLLDFVLLPARREGDLVYSSRRCCRSRGSFAPTRVFLRGFPGAGLSRLLSFYQPGSVCGAVACGADRPPPRWCVYVLAFDITALCSVLSPRPEILRTTSIV